MKKKLLSSFMAVCMILTMLPTAAFAAASTAPTEAVLTSNNETLTVTLAAAPAANDLIKVYDAATNGTLLQTFTIADTNVNQVITLSPAATGNVYVTFTSVATTGDTESTRVESTGYVAPTDKSAATVALAQTSINAGETVTLTVADAKDKDGTALAGAIAVTVTSDGTESTVFTGDVTFTSGAATISINGAKFTSVGTRDLAVTITGVTPANITFTSNALTVTPAAASKLVMKTQPVAPATNGAVLATQPAVEIQDQYGNVVTDATNVITATATASPTWTLGGTTTATASAGVATFTDLTATSTALVNDATIDFTSGQLTKATSGTFNIPAPTDKSAATVALASANVAAGADATLKVTNAKGTDGTTALSGSVAVTVTSDSVELFNGNVSFTSGAADITIPGTALKTAKAYTLTVTIAGVTPANITFTSNTLTVTPAAASKLVMKTQPVAPATNGAVLATQPAVEIQDQYGNVVTTDSTTTITAAATASQGWTLGGTETATAQAGVATFTNLTASNSGVSEVTGATIEFTSGQLTKATSGTFNIPADPETTDDSAATVALAANSVTAGTAATLNVTGAKGTDGNALNGNAVAVTVKSGEVTLFDSTADFSSTAGTVTITIPAEKIKIAKDYVLTVTIAGVTTPTFSSNTLTVTPAAANKLAVTTQPVAPATNGAALATQPVVQIQDQYGNVVTTDSTTVITAAATASPTWTLGGTTTATAVNGVATFSGLTATSDAAVTGATIEFTATGLTKATSDPFNIPEPGAVAPVAAKIGTTSTITNGATGVTVIVTSDKAFDEVKGIVNGNWTVDAGATGLTLDSVALDSTDSANKTAKLTFTGTAAAGDLKIKAAATAFASSANVTAESNEITVTVPAAVAPSVAATIATTSTIANGANGATVTVTSDKVFDTTNGINKTNWTATPGTTGLTLSSVALDSTDNTNKTVKLTFTGTAAEGTLKITAAVAAFASSENVDTISNEITVTVPKADVTPPTDETAPVLSSTSATNITATGATLNFTSDEAGKYYYLVLAATDAAPNATTIKAQGDAIAKGTDTATASANTVAVTGLTAGTAYKAYVVVADAAANTSTVASIAITTAAATSPFSIESIGAASAGGVGMKRTITVKGPFTGAQYLVVQHTEGSGETAKVTATCIQLHEGTTTVEVSSQTTSVVRALITSGMPNLTGTGDFGVTVYADKTSS